MTLSLSGIVLSQLTELIAVQTGLHFPPEKWPDLERGIVAAWGDSDFPSVESYAQDLLTSPWTKSRTEILASHLTVGETYFFRHREALTVLQKHVLPELIRARRRTGRQLRIWCAGCCSGEEPYSLAILLQQMLPDWKDWNLTILGTDINLHFLRRASRGIYREWSFRDTDPCIRDRYFRKLGRDYWEIVPEIKAIVTFAYLNLAQDIYPALLNGTNAMDLIFCRNVLMYFSPLRAKEAGEGLYRSMVEGAWLCVGPSELSQILFSGFEAVQHPGAIFYRKNSHGTPVAVPPPATPDWAFLSVPDRKLGPSLGDVPVSQAVVRGVSAAPQPSPAERARICADQGKLTEALDWCEKAVAADKMNPGAYYLQAAVQQELGRFPEAEVGLKRALYLDQDFALAHFALGNLRQRQGKPGESARHFGNALHVLRAHPKEQIVPESGGIATGRLIGIIQALGYSATASPEGKPWRS